MPVLRLRLKLTPLFFMPVPTIPMATMAMDMVWDTMADMLDTTVIPTMDMANLPLVSMPLMFPFPVPAANAVRLRLKLIPLSFTEVTMVDTTVILMD